MKCSNCGKELSDDVIFCPECGTKVEQMDEEKTKIFRVEEENNVVETPVVDSEKTEETQPVVQETKNEEPKVETESENKGTPNEAPAETAAEVSVDAPVEAPKADFVFCPNCGEKNDLDAMFCGGCGYRFGQDVFQAVNEKKTSKEKDNNKKLGKKIALAVLGVAAVCVIGFVAFKVVPRMFSGKKSANTNYLYYIKDNDVYTTKKNDAKLSYEKYYDYDEDYANGIGFGKGPQFSNDGKYMFYIKRINEDSVGDLYYQKNNKIETEEKIASSVYKFYTFANNTILYQTDDDKLYITDIKGDKEKISSDVNKYIIAENEKNIIFTERDGDEKKLYSYDIGKKSEKNKLATINELCGVSADNKTIVYTKDGSLYVLTDFENEDKIDSDVVQCSTQVDGNKVTIYYAADPEEKEIKCYDLVDDDMYDADKNIKEPRLEDYQKTIVKDSFWGPRETVETDDSYYDDVQKYQEKESRDRLRDSLKQYSSTYYETEVFCYEVGSKEPISLGKYNSDYVTNVFEVDGKALLHATKLNTDEATSVKLSDIYNKGVGYGEIMSDAFENSDIYVVLDKSSYLLDKKYYMDDDKYLAADLTRNGESGKVYLLISEDGVTEVFDVKAKDGELVCESFIDDVSYFYMLESSGENIAFCDMNEKRTSADFYINGTKVDSDVYPNTVTARPEIDDVVFYIKDYDDGNGILYAYNIKTKKSEKISSDAHMGSGVVTVNNNYAYISDFSNRSRDGDLMLYTGKESTRIDSDVSGFSIDLYSFDYAKKTLYEMGSTIALDYYVAPAAEAPAAEEEAW